MRRTGSLRRRALVVLVLTVVSTAAHAFQADPLYDEWRWVRFAADSGLPSARIMGLVETTDGIVWAKTSAGLARYDGYRWHPVTTDRDERAPAHRWALSPDLGGGVVAVVAGRLYRGDGSGGVLDHVPVELEGRPVELSDALPLGDDGELLLVGLDGLYRLGENGLERFPSAVPSRDLRNPHYLRTDAGTIWYLGGSPYNTAFEWTGERWLARLPYRTETVHVNESGGVAVVNHSTAVNGVWTWTGPEAPARLPEEGITTAQAMALNAAGDALVVYHSGRVRLRRGGTWSWLTTIPSELQNAHALLFQRNGDLWAANDLGLALHRASVSRWARWSLGEPVGTDVINAVLPTPEGDLWLGTANGLIRRRADGEAEYLSEILGAPLGVVTALARDREGAVWVGSGADFHGAYRLHQGVWKHFGAEDGLLAPRVHRIVEDRAGRLWFLGLSDQVDVDEPGAFVYDGTRFERWGVPEGLRDGRVFGFAEGPAGELWFGTRSHLSRWDEGRWKHWTLEPERVRVFTIAIAEGRTWFGLQRHGRGLGYVDENDEIRFLTETDGLVDDRVWDLETGPDGALWIGTAGGVGRYRDGRLSSFDTACGLQNPRVWPVVPTADLVHVGSLGGGLYTLSLEEEGAPPPLVEIAAPVVDQDRALFRWKVFSFRGTPEAPLTRYRLDEAPWSSWSTARETSVLGLVSGEHAFEVQAKGMFGEVAASPSSVVLRVPPPLHLHPLFLTAVAGWLAVMAFLGVVYLRKRRHQVEAIRTSEERLRTLLEEIPICIHEIDLDGRLISMNPAGLAMMGLTEERQVVGLRYLDAVAQEDRDGIADLMERAVAGESSEFEFGLADDAERSRRLLSSFVPLRDRHGGVTKLMGYTEDVTDRRHAEKERRAIEQQLQHSQKMEAIGLLAGGVAHDFNNLLTVIGGYAAMIEQAEKNTPRVREALGEILKANERASTLTRQLLAFGRRQVQQPCVLNVGEVVRRVEAMLDRLIGERIDLVFDVADGVGHVRADPVQYEQVIINLVVNARDAIEGDGTIRIAARNRTLDESRRTDTDVLPAGRYVVLDVEDSGTGMDAETRAKVFEPFFTTKTVGQGTGLGLSTVFGIVAQSRGAIVVDSEPGRGSRFSVYLPRVEAAADAPDQPRLPASEPEGSETVLVAEDDRAIRELARKSLEQSGYHVITARDGAEAVRIAESYPGTLDALITDLVMPGLNGREAAERVRELRPDAVAIFMTGYASDAFGTDGGNVVLLEKPFSPFELVSTLRSKLHERDRGRISTEPSAS